MPSDELELIEAKKKRLRESIEHNRELLRRYEPDPRFSDYKLTLPPQLKDKEIEKHWEGIRSSLRSSIASQEKQLRALEKNGERIVSLLRQREKCHRNINRLEEMRLDYGANVPLDILNQLDDARTKLKQVEQELELKAEGLNLG